MDDKITENVEEYKPIENIKEEIKPKKISKKFKPSPPNKIIIDDTFEF